jgi:DNA-binding GntR family transcriptional regulator
VEHLKDHYEVGAGTLREALALLLSDALVVAEGSAAFASRPSPWPIWRTSPPPA